MKKSTILIFLLAFEMSFTQAQITQTLSTVVNRLLSEKTSMKSSELDISVDQSNCKHVFDDFEILKVDSENFRIISNEEGYQLQVVSKNGQLHGFYLDSSKDVGYTLTYKESLISTETSKDNIHFVCPTSANRSTEPTSDNHVDTRSYKLGNSSQESDVLLLESRPGAPNLIYLDFDGEANLPGWGAGYIATNANVPDDIKREMWEAVSEDMLPFNVNVTNNRALFDLHPELNKSWVVVAEYGLVAWGGLATLHSFGTGKPVLIDVPQQYEANDLPFFYNSAAHEIGHALGLNHDGGTTGVYYSGHGEFTPIMGNGNRPVSHWSKGGYPSATNFENDIQIIGSWIGNVPDEFVNSTDLIVNGTSVDPSINFGEIQNQNDLDTFRIVLTEFGNIKLKVSSPIGIRGNLDVNLKLLSADKSTVITSSSPILDRNGYVDETLNSGTYYLVIDGGSELSTSDGWNDYGSLGYYEISGHVGYIAPICDFLVDKNSFCLNDGVVIENKSFGTNLAYQWSVSQLSSFTSSDETPILSFSEAGSKTITLTVSNNSGSATCANTVRIGDKDIRITLPKDKLNEDLTVAISSSGSSLIKFEYSDFIELNTTELYADLCLFGDCYDVVFTDVFQTETCGAEEWDATKNYTSAGLEVVYSGKRYRSQWYINKGTVPGTSNSGWQYIALCEITDATTLIKITNLTDNQELFQTNPLEVGIDLDHTGAFCVGSPSQINVVTQNPNNCEDVVIETVASGTSITWNFGTNASLGSASGVGPHHVKFSTAGSETVTLTIDGVVESKEITIVEALATPTITVSATSTTVCENDEFSFSSTYTHGGNNPTVEWFVNDNSVAVSGQYTAALNDADVVKAVLTSDALCISSATSTSNEISVIVDICTAIDVVNSSTIMVYPNPLNNMVYVKGQTINQVQLIDALGQIISVETDASSGYQFDLSNLTSGVYLLRIKSEKGIEVKKIYKN